MDDKGNLTFVFLIFIILWNKVMAGQFHAPSHPGVLKNINMNGNILQRYFTHKNF